MHVNETGPKQDTNKPDAVVSAKAPRLTIDDRWRRVADSGHSILMKPALFAILITSTTLSRAQSLELDDPSLRTESVEISPSDEGRVQIETTYRGGQRVMVVNIRSSETNRAFFTNDVISRIESDRDGDGHFEYAMIPRGPGQGYERFKRGRDGTLSPMSAAELEAEKRKSGKESEVLIRYPSVWYPSMGNRGIESEAALEPSPAATVHESSNTVSTNLQSELPADGRGR